MSNETLTQEQLWQYLASQGYNPGQDAQWSYMTPAMQQLENTRANPLNGGSGSDTPFGGISGIRRSMFQAQDPYWQVNADLGGGQRGQFQVGGTDGNMTMNDANVYTPTTSAQNWTKALGLFGAGLGLGSLAGYGPLAGAGGSTASTATGFGGVGTDAAVMGAGAPGWGAGIAGGGATGAAGAAGAAVPAFEGAASSGAFNSALAGGGAASTGGGLLSGLPGLGGMSAAELAKLGIGAAGLAAGSSGGGNVANPTDVVNQQAGIANDMLQQQVTANRPNQTSATGATSNWTQDPATGQWSQKVSFGAADQAEYDKINQIQGGLLGQIQNNGSLSTDGLTGFGSVDRSQSPAMGQLDNQGMQNVSPESLQNGVPGMGSLDANHFGMDPVGNSQDIQDATYALLKPQRDQQRDAEISRLKNMGLTEGSAAWNNAMDRLGTGDTNAQLQSLLAGRTEYGNQFNRGLQQNQNNFGQDSTVANFNNSSNAQRFGQNSAQQQLALALRGQQWGERTGMADFANQSNQQDYLQQMGLANLSDSQRAQQFGEQQAIINNPYQQYGLLNGMAPTDPKMPTFATAGLGETPDLVGANAANTASKANTTSGWFDLAGKAANAFF